MSDEDFSSHPLTIGEARCSRGGERWSLHSPRDVLVSMLRDIDSGKKKYKSLIVLFIEDAEDGDMGYRVSSPDGVAYILGCCDIGKQLIFESCRR